MKEIKIKATVVAHETNTWEHTFTVEVPDGVDVTDQMVYDITWFGDEAKLPAGVRLKRHDMEQVGGETYEATVTEIKRDIVVTGD